MKKLLSILFFSFIAQFSFAGELELSGTYQGKNIFIQNPYSEGESSFCTEKVFVNDREITFEEASAFEIRLDLLDLKIGDSLSILIFHGDDCKPKVINNGSHYPDYGFEMVSVYITGFDTLNWVTTNETGIMTFVIQEYRWNKWIKIGEVTSNGSLLENTYMFKLVPHAGRNTVRISQQNYGSSLRFSESVSFTSAVEEVNIVEVDKKNKQIILSDSTKYELWSNDGNMTKKGYGNRIDCSDLADDILFLNYDTKSEAIYFGKKPRPKKGYTIYDSGKKKRK